MLYLTFYSKSFYPLNVVKNLNSNSLNWSNLGDLPISFLDNGVIRITGNLPKTINSFRIIFNNRYYYFNVINKKRLDQLTKVEYLAKLRISDMALSLDPNYITKFAWKHTTSCTISKNILQYLLPKCDYDTFNKPQGYYFPYRTVTLPGYDYISFEYITTSDTYENFILYLTEKTLNMNTYYVFKTDVVGGIWTNGYCIIPLLNQFNYGGEKIKYNDLANNSTLLNGIVNNNLSILEALRINNINDFLGVYKGPNYLNLGRKEFNKSKKLIYASIPFNGYTFNMSFGTMTDTKIKKFNYYNNNSNNLLNLLSPDNTLSTNLSAGGEIFFTDGFILNVKNNNADIKNSLIKWGGQLPSVTDDYLKWVKNNKIQMNAGLLTSGINALSGVGMGVTSSAISGNPLGVASSIFGGLTSAFSKGISLASQYKSQENLLSNSANTVNDIDLSNVVYNISIAKQNDTLYYNDLLNSNEVDQAIIDNGISYNPSFNQNVTGIPIYKKWYLESYLIDVINNLVNIIPQEINITTENIFSELMPLLKDGMVFLDG